MDKRKSKIKRTQRSPREKERKNRIKRLLWPLEKETYGEERKIKNIKGIFLPQNTTHLHLLTRLHDLFLLRSSFWLCNMCKVSMLHFTLPWAPHKLFVEVGSKGNIFCLSEEPHTNLSDSR
jgi:hypothetical protein